MAKKPHGVDPIINAALALAGERGWRGLALADIADRAGVTLAELVEHFPTKAAILDAYVRRVDRAMLDGTLDTESGARDRLFDVIMRRFDAMAGDRAGLRAILRQAGDDPWELACGGRRFLRSMALTLEAAGIAASGLAGWARTNGLAAVYLYAFKTFLDDASADHAATMAALDRALRRADGWAALAFRRQGGHSGGHTNQKM